MQEAPEGMNKCLGRGREQERGWVWVGESGWGGNSAGAWLGKGESHLSTKLENGLQLQMPSWSG